MKKSLIIFTTILSLLFTSCFQPAFYNISQDVSPEKATIVGVINSLVRYKVDNTEYLVVSANGGIRYKKADINSHSDWNTYSTLPFELHTFDPKTSTHKGQEIIKILADANYLYIVSTSYKTDEDLSLSIPDIVSVYAKKIVPNGEVWSTEGEWTQIASGQDYFTFSVYDDYVYSNFNSFCTNAVKPENRKAYLRCGNAESYSSNKEVKYYALNGTDAPTAITPTSFESTNALSTKTKNINSAVIFNGNEVFFNTIASTTNETSEKDATYFYFGNNLALMYSNGEAPQTAISNCGTPISCLAVCSDAILIGRGDYSDTIEYTTGGITKTSLNEEGIPGTNLLDFTTNADIQLSISYLILTLLNVDPSKSELESTFYASLGFAGSGSSTTASVNYKNIGLWSYYPSRGNWNCE